MVIMPLPAGIAFGGMLGAWWFGGRTWEWDYPAGRTKLSKNTWPSGWTGRWTAPRVARRSAASGSPSITPPKPRCSSADPQITGARLAPSPQRLHQQPVPGVVALADTAAWDAQRNQGNTADQARP